MPIFFLIISILSLATINFAEAESLSLQVSKSFATGKAFDLTLAGENFAGNPATRDCNDAPEICFRTPTGEIALESGTLTSDGQKKDEMPAWIEAALNGITASFSSLAKNSKDNAADSIVKEERRRQVDEKRKMLRDSLEKAVKLPEWNCNDSFLKEKCSDADFLEIQFDSTFSRKCEDGAFIELARRFLERQFDKLVIVDSSVATGLSSYLMEHQEYRDPREVVEDISAYLSRERRQATQGLRSYLQLGSDLPKYLAKQIQELQDIYDLCKKLDVNIDFMWAKKYSSEPSEVKISNLSAKTLLLHKHSSGIYIGLPDKIESKVKSITFVTLSDTVEDKDVHFVGSKELGAVVSALAQEHGWGNEDRVCIAGEVLAEARERINIAYREPDYGVFDKTLASDLPPCRMHTYVVFGCREDKGSDGWDNDDDVQSPISPVGSPSKILV